MRLLEILMLLAGTTLAVWFAALLVPHVLTACFPRVVGEAGEIRNSESRSVDIEATRRRQLANAPTRS